MRRVIGMDLHRTFAEVVFWENGRLRRHGRVDLTRSGLEGFGRAVTGLGDLDGDGAAGVAISANEDDDGGSDRGAVWVLFLNVDGTVKAEQKISDLEGGFTGTLDDGDQFGISVAALGDLDGDGAKDVAVGAQGDNDGGEVGVVSQRGAVWVLFLNAVPGDLDNDGVTDADDVCPATVLPEPVPTKRLGPNRYANTDSDIAFETRRRKRASRQEFTMTDTAGCSCAQIIQELGLGQGHTKFGCSVGAMKRFIAGLP